jgi:TatD DNase family protein
VEKGFYIGFTGVICQTPRGNTLRDILSEQFIPLNRLMIETDCPFMSPLKSVRRNEPAFLGHG